MIGPAGTAPFTRTYAQRTRIAEHTVAPVTVHTLPTGSVVVDFGAVYAARPRVTFRSGQAGRTVPMRVGYLLDPDGEVSTTHGTQGTNLSFSYVMTDGPQTFEAFSFLGFRYLQIDDPGEAIEAGQVVALARHAAMPDVPMATFATDDRMLDAVWKLNARSCLYCCHEQFVDTPTREKAQFLWDAANESEAVMRTYGEQNLSWQGLRDGARGQARFWPDGRVNVVYPYGFGARDIPTFTERYPEWVWRYYVSTGDRDTAVTLYPTTARIAGYLWGTQRAGTGLLYGLADVPEGDPTYGYDLGVAADTVSNVLAVNAFTRIAQLADLAGDAAGAATQRARAVQLTTAINRLLVRPDGVYVDGIDADGTPSTHASQEANALALGLRRRTLGARGRGRRVRRIPRDRRRAEPRARVAARVGHGGAVRRHGPDPHRPLGPGLGPDPGQGGHLHLGDLDAERPDRGFHVPRLGLVRPRRHAGDAARADAHGAQPRRHGPGGRGAAVVRPLSCDRVGADHCRAGRGVLAAAGCGRLVGPDRAGQRLGPRAPAGRRIPRACARAALPRRGRPGWPCYSVAEGTAVLSVGSGSYRFTTA